MSHIYQTSELETDVVRVTIEDRLFFEMTSSTKPI